MKVLELKGYKSLRAFNVFNTLLLGLKMLPMYIGETYDEFYTRTQALPDNEKLDLLRQAAFFVELSADEIEAVVGFCTDANGIPYQPANIKNLGPDKIIECIVAVCAEIVKIKIDIINEVEKKN